MSEKNKKDNTADVAPETAFEGAEKASPQRLDEDAADRAARASAESKALKEKAAVEKVREAAVEKARAKAETAAAAQAAATEATKNSPKSLDDDAVPGDIVEFDSSDSQSAIQRFCNDNSLVMKNIKKTPAGYKVTARKVARRF